MVRSGQTGDSVSADSYRYGRSVRLQEVAVLLIQAQYQYSSRASVL